MTTAGSHHDTHRGGITTSIPLHDAQAPVACTIGADEVPQRMELIERLRSNLDRLERSDHGLLLHFPDRPEVDADVRRFAVDEKRCCRFWGLAVDRSGGEVRLRWDAPPAAGELITRIEAYFRGDAPLTSILELL